MTFFTINPDGRYTRVVYVASDALVGRGETGTGTYKVYGRILMMQDARGQVDTRLEK